ncbi:hypothetical protein [Allonocardiopsis opalescens]|uniref:Uncharacterized protein n=1 Tax=Allonocardiopsis opalescens TaxID=1144618 RepID=A0A2T0Q112_9ACTN|nr:hypothetical protein [Allonocardiopsis opalescens]PRX97405.1 hypothetical protein CLV72_106444 [Allonocardiopsis opalescens]
MAAMDGPPGGDRPRRPESPPARPAPEGATPFERAMAELRAAAEQRDPHTGLTRLEQLERDLPESSDEIDSAAEGEDRPPGPGEEVAERRLDEWIRSAADPPPATALARAADLGLSERVARILDRGDPLLARAFADLDTVMHSGRIAGTPRRHDDIYREHLRKLTGADPNNALGAAAELRHAATLLGSGELAPNSRMAISATAREKLDLGHGIEVRAYPVAEADVIYAGNDGRIHLYEIKNTAQALANKIRKSTDQLRRMVQWRDADPDGRRVAVHIGTDQGWTGLLSLMKREDDRSYIVNELIEREIPLLLGSHQLDPERLERLKEAAVDLLSSRDDQSRNLRDWFSANLPDLDAARERLRPWS